MKRALAVVIALASPAHAQIAITSDPASSHTIRVGAVDHIVFSVRNSGTDVVTIQAIVNGNPPHTVCLDDYGPVSAYPAASFPIDVAPGAQQQFDIGTMGIPSVDNGGCSFVVTYMAGGVIHNQTFTASFVTASGGGVPVDMQALNLDFGDQSTTGGFEDQYMFLNNTDPNGQSVPMMIVGTGGDTSAFTFQSDNCVNSNMCTIQLIAPNTFHAVKVRCRTGTVGTSAATVIANSFGEVSMTCKGVAGTNGPKIRVPMKIDAGNVPVHGMAMVDVEIDNIGNQALSGVRVAFDGGTADDWSADDCLTSDCSVPSSDSKTFHVTLAPSASGDRAATMTITSNASNGAQQIALVGTGVDGTGGDAGTGGDDGPGGHRPPSSFYACSSGRPTSAWPILAALAFAARRRRC